jgi:hypothetical protein
LHTKEFLIVIECEIKLIERFLISKKENEFFFKTDTGFVEKEILFMKTDILLDERDMLFAKTDISFGKTGKLFGENDIGFEETDKLFGKKDIGLGGKEMVLGLGVFLSSSTVSQRGRCGMI